MSNLLLVCLCVFRTAGQPRREMLRENFSQTLSGFPAALKLWQIM